MRIFFIGSYKDKPTTGGHLYIKNVIDAIRDIPCDVEIISKFKLPRMFKFKPISFIYCFLLFVKNRPDLIIQVSDSSLRFFLYSIFMYFIDLPVIQLVHHIDRPLHIWDIQRRLNLLLVKFNLRRARAIIVISKYTKWEVIKFARLSTQKKIVIIKPGIDVVTCRGELRKYKAKSNWNILAVGAIIRRKGYDYLIDALHKLDSERFVCHIAGDIQDREIYTALAKKISEYHLNGKVKLRGHISRDELLQLYDTSDLFILPSLHEGYGIVLCEAICQGLPVIATKVGAVPEIIKDNETGLLVKPKSAESIKKALKIIFTKPELAEKLSLNAIKQCRKFGSWNKMKEQVKRFIKNIAIKSILT